MRLIDISERFIKARVQSMEFKYLLVELLIRSDNLIVTKV